MIGKKEKEEKGGQTMVNKQSSRGTINALRKLLDDAENGHLIGIAFIGVVRGRRPVFGCTGYANQDPLFTVGTMQRLNEALLDQAKEKNY